MTGPELYSAVDGAPLPDLTYATRYICPACEGVGKWHMQRCTISPGARRTLFTDPQGTEPLRGRPRYPVIPPVDPEAVPQ